MTVDCAVIDIDLIIIGHVHKLVATLDETGTLRERLQKQGYATVGDEVSDLQAALQDAKRRGFDQHAAGLKRHLEREILARYVSESRQIQSALRYDTQVDAAVALMDDAERYRKILTPNE